MKKNEFLQFLKNGEKLLGIELDQSCESLFSLLGRPLNTVGDKKAGFYQYQHGLRFGYFTHRVDELGVIFYGNNGIKIPIDVEMEDEIFITEDTTINTFIRILNYAKIEWCSCDEKNLDIFCIKTEGNVYVLFDLDTGKISKVSLSTPLVTASPSM